MNKNIPTSTLIFDRGDAPFKRFVDLFCTIYKKQYVNGFMNSYGQYCPVAKAHEILGDRWTMLIVRELVSGRENFNDIARGLPGIPRSLLTSRPWPAG